MNSPDFDRLVVGGGHKPQVLRRELDAAHGGLVRLELGAVPVHVGHPQPDGAVTASRGHQMARPRQRRSISLALGSNDKGTDRYIGS